MRFHNNLLNLLLSRHSPCHLLGHCLTRQAPAIFKIKGSHHVTKCDKPSTCLALHILHTVQVCSSCIYVSWSVKPRGTGCGKIPRSYYSKNEWLLFNWCPTRQKHPKTIHSYLVQSCSMHTWRNFQEHGPMDPLHQRSLAMTRTCCSWALLFWQILWGLRTRSSCSN